MFTTEQLYRFLNVSPVEALAEMRETEEDAIAFHEFLALAEADVIQELMSGTFTTLNEAFRVAVSGGFTAGWIAAHNKPEE